MKRIQLENQFKGSMLKEQYLEAFLMQSAYIEGLFKLYCRIIFILNIDSPLQEKGVNDLTSALRKRVFGFGLAEVINLLRESKNLTEDQAKLMHSYREKRNKVFHDLLNKIGERDFNDELKEACDSGTKILDHNEIKKIILIIDKNEDELEKSSSSESKSDVSQ